MASRAERQLRKAIQHHLNHGDGLEWRDADGKTPLIIACSQHDFHGVAKYLLNSGADVDAYSTGANRGTSLHHAVDMCLIGTVELLLSHGANALLENDYGQNALDVARAREDFDIFRVIEEHIRQFSARLRVTYNALTAEKYVVVMPLSTFSLDHWGGDTFEKFGISIYPSAQTIQPERIIVLDNAVNIRKLSRPSAIIVHGISAVGLEVSCMFRTGVGEPELRIQQFYEACKFGVQSGRPATQTSALLAALIKWLVSAIAKLAFSVIGKWFGGSEGGSNIYVTGPRSNVNINVFNQSRAQLPPSLEDTED